ncbi:MAG: 2Fe-2S iron-sulfur cluster-binding protein [Anaerolineales bacterium]|nr:2Fe-2S iron-sulfur cluster-binding protein [Anaerolineales bacterium]MCS7247928.1 2Fe-2S iron-sulfur cluster-binding protein [Anaerolineales bacterium]MDW8161738.1 2Fe-2S iron-sulfur cluster-binding protein [Anaerolineales bacterium]MDW8445946.1 2Fe-2S iron-sulfur cluster-binding protein [Anaerolineales bacterium]
MTANLVQFTLDGTPAQAPAGTTILKAAQQLGIAIPTICYHDYCTANALCRICVVEVKGARVLVPACTATVQDGMEIHTQSERVQRARRVILEMLYSTVDLSEAPEIEAMAAAYDVDCQRFPQAEPRRPPLIDDNPMYVRDYAKCILCWRCVQVCAEDAQYTYAINFKGRGYETQISTFYEVPMPESTCVFCGQCIGVCPTGALKFKRQYLLEIGYAIEEILQMTRSERGGRRRRAERSA